MSAVDTSMVSVVDTSIVSTVDTVSTINMNLGDDLPGSDWGL